MKLFAFLSVALCLLTARVEAKNGLIYPIAFGKFENHSGYTGPIDLAGTFSDGLAELLSGSGLFFIVPESELVGADKAPITGPMNPAQLLVRGEITGFVDGKPGGSHAEITAVITLIDTATGQVRGVKNIVSQARYPGVSAGFAEPAISLADFKKTNAGQALSAALEDVMGFCIAQLSGLPWSGNVILVKGNQIYFNRGLREGVAAGQVFKVGVSEIVRDPGTGDVLDNRFTEKAQIRVDTVKERATTCSLIIGGGIERGMSVLPKE